MSFQETVKIIMEYKISLYVILFLLLIFVLTYLTDYIVTNKIKKQKPNILFSNLMQKKTADIIKGLKSTYSWGYDYCLYYSSNPNGWTPEIFKITDCDDTEYRFPLNNEYGYNRKDFISYCENNSKIKAITDKNENRERWAVKHIKLNTDKRHPVFDIKLKQTNWVQLQYSWDYFRSFDTKARIPVENTNQNYVNSELKRAYDNQGTEFNINSFCLHLIIISKNGNVILSRISKSKENDYPSTWAATIGEQLEKTDFYSESSREDVQFNHKFIQKWIRRALSEELGVGTDEIFEEYFDEDSIRILSIDMEADIYNIAITGVIKMKCTLNEFETENIRDIDRQENAEFKECTISEVREILLSYPDNLSEYHPSTYLRLLMYYRHTSGTNKMIEELLKKNKSASQNCR